MTTNNFKKPIIDGVIVVEGKSDTSKLKSLFEVDTIETDGYRCKKETIQTIKEIAKHKKIIIFTDPDLAGEKIRKLVANCLDSFDQCFINKQDMITGSKKIGVAEAKPESLQKALEERFSYDKKCQSLTWNEYVDLGFITNKNKRIYLCHKLKISYSNNKQLFKRLNMLNLTFQQIKQILNNEQ